MLPRIYSRSVFCLVFASLLWLTPSAQAQKLPNGTVATINGISITYEDLAMAEGELMNVISQMNEQQRFEALLGYVMDRVLASEAAKKAGLENDPSFLQRNAFTKRQDLHDIFISKKLVEKITDAEVEAYYKENIVKGNRQEEVRARHILLDSKDMADAVLVSLKGGADFAQIAKERSKGPSGSSGGDLGYFSRESMVAEFSYAAFKLKKGAISQPVKTQFGWHIIKLEDKRKKPTPKLEQVRGQIYQLLIGEARREIYEEMRETAEVNFVNIAPVAE
ncbi:MAG: peptidylprolyl isomerase [Rhodobiaceae bacterium]|jgi:peptidyl-prolyl cis-trans isomerase C|nr:peptidylprolyl isomerase [Rhodobiaceae bacterium]MBT5518882.1 peptidylprolyl isomerase [Rhodobiaceae bacterium]